MVTKIMIKIIVIKMIINPRTARETPSLRVSPLIKAGVETPMLIIIAKCKMNMFAHFQIHN